MNSLDAAPDTASVEVAAEVRGLTHSCGGAQVVQHAQSLATDAIKL